MSYFGQMIRMINWYVIEQMIRMTDRGYRYEKRGFAAKTHQHMAEKNRIFFR